MSDGPSNSERENEISLKDLFDILWQDRLLIATVVSVFAVVSVIYSLSLPNQYKASASLAPAQSDAGGLSAGLGQLGGIASIAGVSLARGGSSESRIAQEIMKSWGFIDTFISDHDLAVEIYAAQDWDQAADVLLINDEAYDTELNKWLIKSPNGDLGAPRSWDLFKKFSSMLSVEEDITTGLVTVSLEHYSPKFAQESLGLYLAAINQHMQARQVLKASNNISYLEQEIEKTSISEMQEVFYTIIEEQTKNKMVAAASPDYAFRALGPIMIPEEKSKPHRALICVVSVFIGGVFSVMLVLLRHIYGLSTRRISDNHEKYK